MGKFDVSRAMRAEAAKLITSRLTRAGKMRFVARIHCPATGRRRTLGKCFKTKEAAAEAYVAFWRGERADLAKFVQEQVKAADDSPASPASFVVRVPGVECERFPAYSDRATAMSVAQAVLMSLFSRRLTRVAPTWIGLVDRIGKQWEAAAVKLVDDPAARELAGHYVRPVEARGRVLWDVRCPDFAVGGWKRLHGLHGSTPQKFLTRESAVTAVCEFWSGKRSDIAARFIRERLAANGSPMFVVSHAGGTIGATATIEDAVRVAGAMCLDLFERRKRFVERDDGNNIGKLTRLPREWRRSFLRNEHEEGVGAA